MTNIIAAIIGVLGTLIVTKFDDLLDLFRKTNRQISGTWNGISYIASDDLDTPNILNGVHNDRWLDKYIVEFKQKGRKIKATMRETEVNGGAKTLTFIWEGKIYGDYLIYKSRCSENDKFIIGNGMLYLHHAGIKMSGYFTSNGKGKHTTNSWSGFAILNKNT